MNSPQPLFRVAQVRDIDARAIREGGIAGYELMSRAAAAALALLRLRWPMARRIGVACGPGNNGGDGYVLARLARGEGLDVRLLALPAAANGSAELKTAIAQWHESGGNSVAFESDLPEVDVWVDALFGTGIKRAPEGIGRELIERINASQKPVLALDIPSGLDADSGHAPGACMRASATICFIAGKRGLYTGYARDVTGDVVVDDLQVAPSGFSGIEPSAFLLTPDLLPAGLAPRHRNAHKGEYGHVLCVGGEHGMGGAVRLCAEAALRAGAGLASVATRGSGVAALLAARPEAMTHAVENVDALLPLLAAADVLAVGPGLGQGEWGRALYAAAIACGKPLILDADGLNLLAEDPQVLPQAILTPHPGEAARLLASSTQVVQRDRFAAVEALVEKYRCVVVLKGAGTLVAAPGGTLRVIGAGNPGMATGGMGDVLTGIIASLHAQHLPAFDAASYGALLHGAAADAAARIDGERGLLPSDLFPHLRRMVNPE